MSTLLTPGIIIRQADFRDYDRQYLVYTRDCGKVLVLAKGAKKISSKLNAHLQPFLLSQLMLAQGLAGKRIAAAQTLASYRDLRSNWEKILLAAYFLETVDLLTRLDHQDEGVFLLACDFLATLEQSANLPDHLLCLNKFLFNLLSHLGYCPVVHCQTQRELIRILNNLVVEVGEREVKGFRLVEMILFVKNKNY